jgi:hypothetical protein
MRRVLLSLHPSSLLLSFLLFLLAPSSLLVLPTSLKHTISDPALCGRVVLRDELEPGVQPAPSWPCWEWVTGSSGVGTGMVQGQEEGSAGKGSRHGRAVGGW